MDRRNDPFSDRQLRSLCGVALLSPALRLIPGSAALSGGRAAWAGPLAALPPLLLYAVLLGRLRGAMREGEALPELTLRALGRRAGRIVLLTLGLWLLLYCGFTLRSGAERFLVTVYPRSGPAFFVLSMGLLALAAATGPLRSLLRVARMTAPILVLTLLLILLAALRAADPAELLPLTEADAGALLRGSWPTLDILSFALALLCFFRPESGGRPGRFGASTLRIAGAALLLTALGAAVQGRFGAPLCSRLSAPFFALVRNLVFFRSLERLEALVVALWIFPDFLLTGMTLQAAQRCLRLAFGWTPRPGEERFRLQDGRWLIFLCAGAAIALGLLLAPDQASLLLWSRQRIPLCSMAVSLLLIPGIYAVGKARKKL